MVISLMKGGLGYKLRGLEVSGRVNHFGECPFWDLGKRRPSEIFSLILQHSYSYISIFCCDLVFRYLMNWY